MTAEIGKKGSFSRLARRSSAFRRERIVERVDLVGGHDLRLGRELGSKQLQLAPNGVEILDGIASGRARHVHDVHQHLGALEVAQELMAEAEAAMRAFDQPGHVGDDEAAIAAQSPTTPRFGVSVVNG